MKIKYKISTGYVVILISILVSGIINIVTLRKSRKIDNEISKIIQPCINLCDSYLKMTTKSGKLSYNWIYLGDETYKNEIAAINDSIYPSIKSKLAKTIFNWIYCRYHSESAEQLNVPEILQLIPIVSGGN